MKWSEVKECSTIQREYETPCEKFGQFLFGEDYVSGDKKEEEDK